VTTKPPTFYPIPAGTPERGCQACDEPMFFIETPRGARMPVSCDIDGAYPPTATSAGQGISHYITCTNPERFSKGGRR
jgi:hypothetical protein